MSRRKQARPRLVKRDEDDEEEEDKLEDSESQPAEKKLKLSEEKPEESASEDVVESGDQPSEPEVFRCETCSAVFDNLVQFMDHRNSQCETGKLENGSRSDTPSSLDSSVSITESTGSLVDGMDPDQLPFNIGVDEDFPVPCQFCEKAFAKMSHLKLHEQTHSDMMPYSCGVCSRVFRHKRSRDRHVKLHSGYKKYKCSDCGAAFSRSDHLKNHIKTHGLGEQYPCQTCGLEYPTMAALMSHQNAHKPKTSTAGLPKYNNKCNPCGGVFFSEKELESHDCAGYAGKAAIQCQHCSAICVGATALALHTEHAHPTGSGETNKCPICFKCFLTLEELTAHMKVHDSSSPDLSGDAIITHTELPSMEYSTSLLSGAANGLIPSDILVCPYCLRDDFETLESLEIHMQGVHSVKPTEVYTCNYCNAPYKNLYSLHEHMRAIHQSQPSMGIKYPCSRCGAEYPSIESLQDHKKRMHHYKNKDRVYSCAQCPITFLSSTLLKDHMHNVHGEPLKVKDNTEYSSQKSPKTPGLPKPPKLTSSKPKDCYMVNDSPTIINVPEPSHLLRHLKSPIKTSLDSPTGTVHHSASTSSSPGAAAVVSHFHPPASMSPDIRRDLHGDKFTCEHCNSVFTDLTSYQSHMKLHIDSVLGQYGCRQCGKLFLSEDQLETHISSHYLALLTEFSCTTCNKSFNKPDELQKHLMDIHAHHLFKCSLCKEVFDSKVNIQVHFAIKHSNESKLFRCVACELMFRSESEWQVHLRVTHLHISKPYRCLFCKESFASEMDLQCHLATHNKPFKCSMCEESFLVEFLLDKHLQSVHSSEAGITEREDGQQNGVESTERGSATVHVKNENDTDMLKNDAISSPAINSSIYSSLIGSSRNLMADSNGLLPGDTTVYSNLTSSSGGSMVWRSPDDLYRCNICDMKFSQVSGLQTHKMQDHGVRYSPLKSPYSPSSSPKISTPSSVDNLASVYSSLLSQAPPDLLTSAADKASTSLLHEALKSSMSLPLNLPESSSPSVTFTEKLVSSFGEKLCLACPFCSQTFKCKSDLEKHSKIHLNTGSQKCNICDEVFASSGILAEHKLTHCKIQQGNICVACKIPLRSEDQFYLHSQEHGFQGAVMQCIVCRQTLASLLELQMHGRHHFQTRATFYTCCVCLKSFESCDNLISKMNSSGRNYYLCKPCYHGEVQKYSCGQCSLTFDSSTALAAHQATHKKSYQCIKCQESFNSEHEIQMHVASHMMKEGNVHECKLCFIILDSPAKLQCHLIEHTFKNMDYMCSICGRNFEKATDIQSHALEHGLSARKYGCTYCNQKFFFSAELENHLFVHKDSTGPVVNSNQTLVIQPLHTQSITDMMKGNNSSITKTDTPIIGGGDDTKCFKCNIIFPTFLELCNHTKTCTVSERETTVQCSHCPATFSNVALLQKHFFSTHTSPNRPGAKTKPTCMECGKECSTESNLLMHLKTHKKGSKFSCSTCKKSFGSGAALASHQKSNCAQKLHECDVCHRRFAKKCNMIEHMKTHSDEKIYPCPFCGKLFSQRAVVKAHMKIHENMDSSTSTVTDEDPLAETSSSNCNETGVSINHTSEEEELSDPEKDGMKQEVTSTSNIAEDTNSPTE